MTGAPRELAGATWLSEAESIPDSPQSTAQKLLRVDAELREQPAVLLGVDLIGQLLIGLGGLVGFAALLQQLENLVLRDFHSDLRSGWSSLDRGTSATWRLLQPESRPACPGAPVWVM